MSFYFKSPTDAPTAKMAPPAPLSVWPPLSLSFSRPARPKGHTLPLSPPSSGAERVAHTWGGGVTYAEALVAIDPSGGCHNGGNMSETTTTRYIHLRGPGTDKKEREITYRQTESHTTSADHTLNEHRGVPCVGACFSLFPRFPSLTHTAQSVSRVHAPPCPSQLPACSSQEFPLCI